jgi:ribonuclease HI
MDILLLLSPGGRFPPGLGISALRPYQITTIKRKKVTYDMRKIVTIATDGSCINNGKEETFGGWAAVLAFGEHRKEISGCTTHTTNNRMELQAIVESIKQLKVPCDVTFVTDNAYICRIFSSIKKWEDAGWYRSRGNRPKNLDLLMDFMELGRKGNHKFRFQYIDSLSEYPDSKRADFLAKSNAQTLRGRAYGREYPHL